MGIGSQAGLLLLGHHWALLVDRGRGTSVSECVHARLRICLLKPHIHIIPPTRVQWPRVNSGGPLCVCVTPFSKLRNLPLVILSVWLLGLMPLEVQSPPGKLPTAGVPCAPWGSNSLQGHPPHTPGHHRLTQETLILLGRGTELLGKEMKDGFSLFLRGRLLGDLSSVLS